jgi:flavin reductase (DIM6/NTAB) family NADH-FMN oxidoreductase RutF
MADWLKQSGVFAANVLAWNAQLLADRFAGYAPLAASDLRDVDHTSAVTGSPILRDCLVWADCRLHDSFPAGDHACFLGKIVALGTGQADRSNPLLYFMNRYRRLLPLDE